MLLFSFQVLPDSVYVLTVVLLPARLVRDVSALIRTAAGPLYGDILAYGSVEAEGDGGVAHDVDAPDRGARRVGDVHPGGGR